VSDVVIIGGSAAGRDIAMACFDAGLEVIVVEPSPIKPAEWPGEWLEGRGVVSGPGLVAVLDPATADERRLVQATAVVIAVEKLNAAEPSGKMLGITKLGAELSDDGCHIKTDSRGRTRAKGIYAAGSCASVEPAGLIEELIAYCSSSLSKS
jgi:thioredoxin reductase